MNRPYTYSQVPTLPENMLGPTWEGTNYWNPDKRTGYIGGLLDEEGPGTMTGYKEVEQLNPLDQAYIPPELAEQIRLKKIEEFNKLRRGIPGEETSMVMREAPHVTPSGFVETDRTSLRWMPMETTFTQAPESMMEREYELASSKLNPTPSYLATSPDSVRNIPNHQNVITPYKMDKMMEGILADDSPSATGISQLSSDELLKEETGWERNKHFRPDWMGLFNQGMNIYGG